DDSAEVSTRYGGAPTTGTSRSSSTAIQLETPSPLVKSTDTESRTASFSAGEVITTSGPSPSTLKVTELLVPPPLNAKVYVLETPGLDIPRLIWSPLHRGNGVGIPPFTESV